jgi:HEAT repeat protein
LIVAALEDDDLEVQAIAVGQLRDRQVPNALALLLAKAESDSAAVRRVAQNNLKEFHFERFASVFETLAGDMRTSTGRLVRKADPEGIEKLNEELRSRSRFKRLRAVQMTVAMNAVTDVDKEIIERLSDDDQGVRIEAAKALALSKSQQAKRALRDALLDRSRAVQEAAEASLYALTHTIEKTEITP